MNDAQKEVLQNVKRAADSAGRLAESGYHLTKDEGARKSPRLFWNCPMVEVMTRELLEQGK